MTAIDTHILSRQSAVDRLAHTLHNGAVPHAMLFTGLRGTGKSVVARALAMRCNCTAHPHTSGDGGGLLEAADSCKCRSCHKIRSETHPDIHQVRPSGAYIRIDQIREFCQNLLLKPYEGRYRVAMIHDAETMNPEAANALLKMLEEPPPRTVIILMAPEKSDLLPTIVSRCQEIRFSPIPAGLIADYLLQRYGLAQDEISTITETTGGSLSGLDTKDGLRRYRRKMQRRQWLLETFAGLLNPRQAAQPLTTWMLLAETIAAKKETAGDDLTMIAGFLRDCIIAGSAPERIRHTHLETGIRAVSECMPTPSLLQMAAFVQTALQQLQSNTNLRLTLDVLMINIYREAAKAYQKPPVTPCHL